MQTINRVSVVKLLHQTGSIKEGHFILSSGLHSNQYFQCANLLQHPKLAQYIGFSLAAVFDENIIDVVIGPALGGIIISYEVARALDKRALFAERVNSELCLRRGFNIEPGERVLIIEDVITTAKSALETARLVESYGGVVAGYGCIVDRSENRTGLNLKSLIHMNPEIYTSDQCPLCMSNIPVEKPGSRR